MTKSLVIVGGGAAGICAALGAAKFRSEHGLKVGIHLLERNPRLGIKILISGGGKCNITHTGPINTLLREGFLRKNEQRFLQHALHAFTNDDILELLERRGVPCHARKNGRIFPDSARAEDVLTALEQEIASLKIDVRLSTRVLGVRESTVEEKAGRWQIELPTETLTANAVILTTGGVSYSKTGTTGDGLHYANILEHEIVPLRSALAPIYLKTKPASDLQGVALRNVTLSLYRNEKLQESKRGDVLITHNGISGPAVLDISRSADEMLEFGPVHVGCNLIGRNAEELRPMLIELQQTRASQQIGTWLAEILPNSMVSYILDAANIPHDRRWNALQKSERAQLIETLTNYSFGLISEIPIERAEVTAGGIALSEVDPKTMMSQKCPDLYFAGEMLDVAGEIGGYNLQAAYSTGWLAGKSAMVRLSTL